MSETRFVVCPEWFTDVIRMLPVPDHADRRIEGQCPACGQWVALDLLHPAHPMIWHVLAVKQQEECE